MREMLILQKLNHPNIISLYNYDVIDYNIYWSLNDYCNLGPLSNLLNLKSLEISDPYTYIHIDISSQKAKLFDFKAEC